MSEIDFFFCPLECGARIKSLKHISKCKNGKLLGVKYKLCEYNSAHIIKNELYQIHLLSCESKKKYEEDKSESLDDDDLIDKLSESSDNENKEDKKIKNDKKDDNDEKKENENENEENNVFRRKRRYKHEKALYKDEEEIDPECLDFFNKVYI